MLGSPKFSAPPRSETVRRTSKIFQGAATCSRPSVTMPTLVKLGFHPLLGRPIACLSVTLLNIRDCAPDFAMKALQYRNDLDAIAWGKVCSCASVFNFLRLLPSGNTTKCWSPKNGKILGFSLPEGDRINRSRLNLACKYIPWVCSSTPN